MLKTTLKAPKTDKKTKGIIGACDSASEIAQALHAFWGSGVPGADEKFILNKLSALLQQAEPSEEAITKFITMTTALMGKTLSTAFKDMFGSSSLLFLQFTKPAGELMNLSWMNIQNPKVWKFIFVTGDMFRIRPAIKAWKDAVSPQDKDAAAQRLREIIGPLQEANGSLKGSVVTLLTNRVGDLLNGSLVNIFSMMALSTEQPRAATIDQSKADAMMPDVKNAGAALLDGLSNPASAAVSETKQFMANWLDDVLEKMNLRNAFGDAAPQIKDALVNGRFGYGSYQTKNGCQNHNERLTERFPREQLKEYISHAVKKVEPVIEELRGKFLEAAAISDADASEWVAGLKISKSLMNEYDAFYASEGQFIRDLKDVYRLAGGRLPTLTAIELNRDRSYASLSKKVVSLNPRGGKPVLWHEVGHHFEYSNPDYHKMALAFLTERAGGKRDAIAPLRQFYRNTYSVSEVAVTDNFSSPYVGKVYGATNTRDVHDSRATEIFSSAFEYLARNKSGATSLLNGDELLQFACGILKEVHSL